VVALERVVGVLAQGRAKPDEAVPVVRAEESVVLVTADLAEVALVLGMAQSPVSPNRDIPHTLLARRQSSG
jgi:hypothetical protein